MNIEQRFDEIIENRNLLNHPFYLAAQASCPKTHCEHTPVSTAPSSRLYLMVGKL